LVSLHYFQLLFLWGHLAWHETSIPNHPLPLSTTPHPLSEASFHDAPWQAPYGPIHKPILHTSSHHGKNQCLAGYWKSTWVSPRLQIHVPNNLRVNSVYMRYPIHNLPN
jgi:hypothetical protein